MPINTNLMKQLIQEYGEVRGRNIYYALENKKKK